MTERLDRRAFIRASALASAALASTGAEAGSEPDPKAPNIILIMADQYRGDCLGSAGNQVIRTPHLDRLAGDGVLFNRAYTAVPSCTPARAGLLTGLAPWHHGMLGYGRVAGDGRYRFEMPRMLRDAGYYTFGIGKMHWFPQKTLHGFHGTLVDESGRVESPGFVSDYRDWFKLQAPGEDPDATGIGWNEHRAGAYKLEERLHPTAWTGGTAAQLITNYRQARPLFLKVSFARPHSPYDPPQRFLDLYREEDMPAPSRGDWCGRFADRPETPDAAFGDFGTSRARSARRAYYGNVSFIDEQVGIIVDALQRKGLYENSLIVFTADHGDMLGDHHHWRKTYAYEGSARIPCLVKWPSGSRSVLPRGSSLPHPVELRDLLPTFLDAAGRDVPGGMDGRSLMGLIGEKDPEWREYIELEHSTCYEPENYWAALTDGRTKYIYNFPTGGEQLFDLANDPGELHELSRESRFQNLLEAWRSRMAAHLEPRGEEWVRNGRLLIRKEGMLYSPNYPGE